MGKGRTRPGLLLFDALEFGLVALRAGWDVGGFVEVELGAAGRAAQGAGTGDLSRVISVLREWSEGSLLEGNQLEVETEDRFAVVLQHEIDHLDGVLFIDKISLPAGRMMRPAR